MEIDYENYPHLGKTVQHPKYGRGRIIGVDHSEDVWMQFEGLAYCTVQEYKFWENSEYRHCAIDDIDGMVRAKHYDYEKHVTIEEMLVEEETPAPIETIEAALEEFCLESTVYEGVLATDEVTFGETVMLADYDPHEPGAKSDQGKPRMGLIMGGFSRALTEVARVGTFGADKYTDNGWVSVENGEARYTDAMFRHYMSEVQGERLDSESELMHSAHLAWNALARLELSLRKRDEEERISQVACPVCAHDFCMCGDIC
jgi:hypothetical protein